MTYVAAVMLASIMAIRLLWIYYLAVMNLRRANNASALIGFAKWLARSVEVEGLILDFAINATLMMIIFFELPRELTVTKRLERHSRGPDGRRKNIAKWFCSRLLDQFDPSGCHCK